jgi:hypothetical protein
LLLGGSQQVGPSGRELFGQQRIETGVAILERRTTEHKISSLGPFGPFARVT